MMSRSRWHIQKGNGALVAAAVHDGHALRDDVAPHSALSESERLREEDPYTGLWTDVADTRIIASYSRFQVDLNRPRDRAVYRRPEDAWGLSLWKNELPGDVIIRSLQEYDDFYAEVRKVLSGVEERHSRFVVYDIHSYNHRRAGPDGPPADPDANPEVNVGTGTLKRERWAPVIDRFIEALRAFDYQGRRLDVRENVKFRGGQFPRWIHETFPESGCALAIEFKKFFMDEWTGELDRSAHEAIRRALAATVPAVLEGLEEVSRG